MVRTPAEALARAKATTSVKPGLCLKYTRGWYGVAARYPHAARAWAATRYRHTSTPPAGAPVWWTGGSSGYGHVAISDGAGYVISTDVPSAGRVGRVKIADLTRRWGLIYRGWSNDLNGVVVYPIRPAPPERSPGRPVVDLAKLRKAARTDPPRASSKAAYPTGTKVVERALVAEGLLAPKRADAVGHFGSDTVAAYAAWQRSAAGGGFRGADADGIPGRASLSRLGRRHGFDVG